LTIFIEEVINPQGDHYLLRGGFLDNIFSLEDVVTCSGSLLVLAEGWPGGGGRRSGVHSFRTFSCLEDPTAGSRSPLVVDDFGFAQGE
jgi:hypothetical protein